MARCSALLLLAVLFAAASTLTLAFAPGAAVGRQGGLATAFWGRVWGPKQQQQQLALGRLMATRGGVAGGKVGLGTDWALCESTDDEKPNESSIGRSSL